MNFLETKIVQGALLFGTLGPDIADPLRLDNAAVASFVGSLSSHYDVSWALRQQRRFFSYGVMEDAQRTDGSFGVDVIRAAIVVLQSADNAYDWQRCREEIANRIAGGGAAAVEAAPAPDPAAEEPAANLESAEEHSLVAVVETGATPYDDLSVQELIEVLLQRDSTINALQRKIKNLGQTKRRFLKRSNVEREAAKTKRKLEFTIHGKKRVRLSVEEGFRCAIKRSIANIAASTIGIVSEKDIHGQTVATWELKMRAAHIDDFNDYCAQGKAVMNSPLMESQPGLLASFTQYRSDATNGQVWQRSKLHVTEIQQSFVMAPIMREGQTMDDVFDSLATKALLGDLQVIKDSSAAGTLGCQDKQMKAIGCPTLSEEMVREALLPQAIEDGPRVALEAISWVPASELLHIQDAPAHAPPPSDPWVRDADGLPPARFDLLDGPSPPASPAQDPSEELFDTPAVQVWLSSTDAGSDEANARKSALQMTMPRANTLYFDTDCLAHQYQLIVKSTLVLLDRLIIGHFGADRAFKYFSTVSKIMVFWR